MNSKEKKSSKFSFTTKKIFSNIYSLKQSLIIIAILSIFSVIFQAIMQNGFSSDTLNAYLTYFKSPLLILFNFLPIFLLTTFFYFLISSISKSFIIVNLPLIVILIINHYKIYFLDAPLILNDFITSKEAVSIIQNYKLEFNFRIFFLSLIMLLVFVLLIKYIHNKHITLKIRILGMLLTLTVIFLSYSLIYKNTELYENIAVTSNEFYDVDIINSKGLLYSLISKTPIQTLYTKPSGYSNEKINNLINDYTLSNTSEKKMPNVIAIMSESFFDPQEAENLKFYPDKNPLKNFNELKKDSYYGKIIVPGFAGSTASTEFEFLTGMNISLIDTNMPNVYKTHITNNIYSLVKVFKDLNYETLAIHPGFSWFYNRNAVYKYMNFDNMIFKSDLPEKVEQVNFYVSDNVTGDLIIDNYKKHLEENPDKGYFNFTVTIQNHGPYIDNKINGEPSVIKPEDMNEKLYNIVSNYMNGLSDTDNLLGKVTDYASALDTPTVVIFFGDHLPYFDSELQSYKNIGYKITEDSLDSLKLKYSVPYIIWGNEAAKSLIVEQGGVVMQGQGSEISSNYLAVELLKYINMDLPPFFNFLDKIKQQITILSPNYYFINNNFSSDVPNELTEELNNYKIWQYYNLRAQ